MKNILFLVLLSLAFNSIAQIDTLGINSKTEERINQKMYDIKLYQNSEYVKEVNNTMTIKLDTFEVHLCMPINQRASVLFTQDKKIYKAFKKNKEKAILKHFDTRSGAAEGPNAEYIFLNSGPYGYNYWGCSEDTSWCRFSDVIIKDNVIYGSRVINQIEDTSEGGDQRDKRGVYYMIISYVTSKGMETTRYGFDMIELVIE